MSLADCADCIDCADCTDCAVIVTGEERLICFTSYQSDMCAVLNEDGELKEGKRWGDIIPPNQRHGGHRGGE